MDDNNCSIKKVYGFRELFCKIAKGKVPYIYVDFIERIEEIRTQKKDAIDIAIELCMYCMKTQVFKDGNKRASVIFANHYLIANGMGCLVIPEKEVPEFKKLLISYYEGETIEVIRLFLKEKCWKNF